MTLGEIIKNARINKGISQKVLAERLNTSPQNLAQYENDRRKPKIDTLRKIAHAMDITIGELSPEIWEFYSPNEWGDDFIDNFKQNASKGLQGKVNQALINFYQHTHDTVDSDAKIAFLLAEYEKLNSKGRIVAYERIKELTEIRKYTDPDEALATDPDHKE